MLERMWFGSMDGFFVGMSVEEVRAILDAEHIEYEYEEGGEGVLAGIDVPVDADGFYGIEFDQDGIVEFCSMSFLED